MHALVYRNRAHRDFFVFLNNFVIFFSFLLIALMWFFVLEKQSKSANAHLLWQLPLLIVKKRKLIFTKWNMLNYVTINRYYVRIEIEFDPNEKEIKLNFEKKKELRITFFLMKTKIKKYLYNKLNSLRMFYFYVVLSHIRCAPIWCVRRLRNCAK